MVVSQVLGKYDEIICKIYFKSCHTALRCWNRFNFGYQLKDMPQELALVKLYEASMSKRIMYSRASSDMISNYDNFFTQTHYLGNDNVMIDYYLYI